ncbi:MAG: Flp pilus assembly protein CpaB [Rhodobacterales bacterium]|nr:Flp pilus assembly protein CpaB [Rhodobacterales bacterium]NCT11184.1 Flp pilus assembly protein CpaB [Rhodobacterales bacterium]
MRAVFGLVLILGLGLAGFAVYMVQGYFETQNAQLEQQRRIAAQQVRTVDVYAVNRTINYGEPLTPADVSVIKYAEPFLPEGVFLTEAELFPNGPDVPRVVLRQMDLNEPVLMSKVTGPGEDAGITTRLSIGMRAFTIGVDLASGMSGVRPGNRVDVYWTGSSGTQEGATQEITQLIQSGVRLIAVDQSGDPGTPASASVRSVTVEVTPQQVAILAQAQATGSLKLSLVGNMDETVAQATEVNQRILLGIQERQVVEVEQEAVCTIRTRRGADVVEIPIPCTN